MIKHFSNQVIKRKSSYTVDVYLLRNIEKKGKAGEIITVKPGYARNVLLPSGAAILMGEGKFRKQLPVIEKKEGNTENIKLTARAVEEEIQMALKQQVPLMDEKLLEDLRNRNLLNPSMKETKAAIEGKSKVDLLEQKASA